MEAMLQANKTLSKKIEGLEDELRELRGLEERHIRLVKHHEEVEKLVGREHSVAQVLAVGEENTYYLMPILEVINSEEGIIVKVQKDTS